MRGHGGGHGGAPRGPSGAACPPCPIGGPQSIPRLEGLCVCPPMQSPQVLPPGSAPPAPQPRPFPRPRPRKHPPHKSLTQAPPLFPPVRLAPHAPLTASSGPCCRDRRRRLKTGGESGPVPPWPPPPAAAMAAARRRRRSLTLRTARGKPASPSHWPPLRPLTALRPRLDQWRRGTAPAGSCHSAPRSANSEAGRRRPRPLGPSPAHRDRRSRGGCYRREKRPGVSAPGQRSRPGCGDPHGSSPFLPRRAGRGLEWGPGGDWTVTPVGPHRGG